MFKTALNMFKSNSNNAPVETPEMQQIKLLSNLILQQQSEIKQLVDRVLDLETEIEYRPCMNEVDGLLLLQQMQLDKLQKSVEFDVKLNQFKNEFYANCAEQGLTKSAWSYRKCMCVKMCESDETCKEVQRHMFYRELELLELIETIANKIMIYANKHMRLMLQKYKDEFVNLNSNTLSMFRIYEIIEKPLSEHGNHPYYNYYKDYFNRNHDQHTRFGNAVQKMKDTVVPEKEEKIIKLMVQFIDNILTLF
jgi:hypothetical protein